MNMIIIAVYTQIVVSLMPVSSYFLRDYQIYKQLQLDEIFIIQFKNIFLANISRIAVDM